MYPNLLYEFNNRKLVIIFNLLSAFVNLLGVEVIHIR